MTEPMTRLLASGLQNEAGFVVIEERMAGMCRLSVERGGYSISLPLLPDERLHMAMLLCPALAAVAEAVFDLGRYEDWSEEYESHDVIQAPLQPGDYNAARQSLYRAMCTLGPRWQRQAGQLRLAGVDTQPVPAGAMGAE